MTILSHPFFTEQILPFLLVFTLIFAILDKTKILGDEKRQVNAIVAFVIGLILIAFPYPRHIIVGLMPLLAVLAVIILVFMLLYSFAAGEKEFKMPKGLKITFGVLIGMALIVAVLVLTGYWNIVVDAALGGEGADIAAEAFFIIVVAAAVVLVLWSGKERSGKSD
ncbi:MAG: hypothetical protein AABX71_03205 [Nanoarchaeota archaeon]